MDLSQQAQIELGVARLKKRAKLAKHVWPAEYINSETGKVYKPHNASEELFVYEDEPRYPVAFGSEGSGKSTAGIVKVLNRLRRGCNGAIVNPDLPHFSRSLWPEFKRWCPREMVIDRHQYVFAEGWNVESQFTLVFRAEGGGYSELICGGARLQDIKAWEGPNLNFVLIDEARRYDNADAFKTFDGRVRIVAHHIPPQLMITTSKRKNWLHEYFAGAEGDNVPMAENDPMADFKQSVRVAIIQVEENRDNLAPGFIENRRRALTGSEGRVLIDNQWEDEEDTDKFVSLVWWDNCRQNLPSLTRNEPMILALDAAKGGSTRNADSFAVVGVTRHPIDAGSVAVRYVQTWTPPKGDLLDYRPIEEEIRRLCQTFSVIEICFDNYQLHDFTYRLAQEGIALFKDFSQGAPRLVADKQLQDKILARTIAHAGDPTLRQHIDNADAKKDGNGLRLVKRTASLHIDAAVALSMAVARCLYYNI